MNIFDQDLEKNGAARSAFRADPDNVHRQIQKFALRELAAAASPPKETPK